MPRRRRKPVTLDAEGNTLSGLGQDTPAPAESTTQGIGASIWDFLHPGQVQSEYVAAGATAPSEFDIMTGAIDTAAQKAAEDVQTVEQAAVTAAQAVPSLIKWIAVAVIAYVILQILPKGRG